MLAYINPNLNSKGQLFAEASSRQYLVKNETGNTFLLDFGEFYCGIVDMTNPDAYNWYKGKKKFFVDILHNYLVFVILWCTVMFGNASFLEAIKESIFIDSRPNYTVLGPYFPTIL